MAILKPSLQIADCYTVTSIIAKGFNEKGKTLTLVEQKKEWFTSGLSLIRNLLSLKENKALTTSIALNVCLMFLTAVEDSKDPEVKNTYQVELHKLLDTFCTHTESSIVTALMEDKTDLPTITIPTIENKKKSKSSSISGRFAFRKRPIEVSDWGTSPTWSDNDEFSGGW